MKYRITIPEPCHENWDKMTPTEKGRFCAVCEKNLVDFTTYSSRQLFQHVASEKNICGRFREDQLDRFIYEQAPKKSGIFNYAFTSLLAVLAAKSSTAKPIEIPKSPIIENSIHLEESEKSMTKADTLTILGSVVDSTGLPFHNVEVAIDELPYGAFTNDMGEFQFIVREKIELDSITFVIHTWANDWYEFRISTKSLNTRKPVKIILSKRYEKYGLSSAITGLVTVENERGLTLRPCPIEEPARASLWKRIGNWFRWVF